MMLYGGATIGSLIGGAIGAHWGGAFGFPSIALGTIGTFVGLYLGYKVSQMVGD